MNKTIRRYIENKRLLIHHHLGLGDHFVCNGLINFTSEISQQHISLICRKQNYVTVCCLYSENKNIHIVPVDTHCHGCATEKDQVDEYALWNGLRVLRVGFDHCDLRNWDVSFYNQLGINFIERYNSFKLPKIQPETLLPVPNQKYIFVHDESSDGQFNLNIQSNLPRIRVNKTDTNNVLAYLELIQNAEEIHCVNSSLFHLVDSIPNTTKKLYYHDARYDPCYFKVSTKWDIIKY